MKNKVMSICLIIAILVSIILLAGYRINKNEKINQDEVEIEKKLESIQADAVISFHIGGGECDEYFEYHICYDNAKLYEYYIFEIYPMTNIDDETSEKSSSIYEFNEYDISKENIEQLKQCISKAMDNKKTEGNYHDYKLKIGNENYYIKDYKTINEILNEITGKKFR